MKGDATLTPPQAAVMQMGLLDSGFNAVLQMPTSSGKTWLAERAIERTLEAGRRAIYLSPLRMLARELTDRWAQAFAAHPVGIFTGDYGRQGRPYPVPFQEARLLVMTPERLDFCTRHWRDHWDWLPETAILVVDEVHLLGDGDRGGRLEGTISRFRRLNPFARILSLSATLGNLDELAGWLDAVPYRSAWRKVPLSWRTAKFRKVDEKPRVLVAEVRRCVAEGGRSLVFVQSRRRAEQLAQALRDAGLKAAHHHAGLGHAARQRVEETLRRRELDALVATSTMEMGVNVPVRQVVLYDIQHWDGSGYAPLSVTSVWQRVGRAGRPGLDDHGEAVLIAPSWTKTPEYEKGRFERVESPLGVSGRLAEQILVEVDAGLARTRAQVAAVLGQTLAARQGRLPPRELNGALDAMLAAGMLRELPDDDPGRPARLKTTPLGRIAVRHMLSPRTVLLLKSAADRLPDATFLDLLIVAACAPDMEGGLLADFEELEGLAALLAGEPSVLLRRPAGELRALLGRGGRELLGAIKTALAVRWMTRTDDDDGLAGQFACYGFELVRVAEACERITLAMAAVFETLRKAAGETGAELLDDVRPAEKARMLSAMVAGRVDERAVGLTLIDGLGRTLSKRLASAGIGDLAALARADAATVAGVPGISAARAADWIGKASAMVAFGLADPQRYVEHDAAAATVADWEAGVDPYRLLRAMELKAERTGDAWRVTGGADPHLLTTAAAGWACDCADFAKGNTCKHVLAVRLAEGDAALAGRLAQLAAPAEARGALDLVALWAERGSLST